MALTFASLTSPRVLGNRKVVDATVTFDSTYAAGGETIAAADLGLGTIQDILILESLSGYGISYNRASGTLQAFRTDQIDDPEEDVPASTNLSAVTARIRAEGTG